jgi:PIN domain nuclease of toxin-antitoxin system
MAELARKYLREGVAPETIRGWLRGISEATEVCDVDVDLALASTRAAAELTEKARMEGLEKPGLGDAVVLATARVRGASVLTGDAHFKGLPEAIWLGDGP